MKQTAVEWLVDKYIIVGGITQSMVEQAKEMEKEQIIDALQEFLDITLPDEVCEKYYNETFKSE